MEQSQEKCKMDQMNSNSFAVYKTSCHLFHMTVELIGILLVRIPLLNIIKLF